MQTSFGPANDRAVQPHLRLGQNSATVSRRPSSPCRPSPIQLWLSLTNTQPANLRFVYFVLANRRLGGARLKLIALQRWFTQYGSNPLERMREIGSQDFPFVARKVNAPSCRDL